MTVSRTVIAATGGAVVALVGSWATTRAADNLPAVRGVSHDYAVSPEPVAEDGSSGMSVAIGRYVFLVSYCLPVMSVPGGVVPSPCAMGDGQSASVRQVVAP